MGPVLLSCVMMMDSFAFAETAETLQIVDILKRNATPKLPTKKNVRMRSERVREQSGKVTEKQEVEYLWDSLERVRSEHRTTIFGRDGKIERSFADAVYFDGEVTVELDRNYSATKGSRLGKTLYAGVYDGSRGFQTGYAHLGSDVEMEAKTFLDSPESLSEARLTATDKDGIWMLKLPCKGGVTELFVDAKSDWAIVKTGNGKSGYQRELEWKEVEPNMWFAVRVKNELFTGIAIKETVKRDGIEHKIDVKIDPYTEVIRVTEIVVNDPKVSDDDFAIRLPKGTLVFDSRAQVEFVVGEKELAASQIREAAEAAKKKLGTTPASIPTRKR